MIFKRKVASFGFIAKVMFFLDPNKNLLIIFLTQITINPHESS